MVRFFQNPYEEFKPDMEVAVDKGALTQQIDEQVKTITDKLKPTSDHVEGGLYVGITGVAYMFYVLAKNQQLSDRKKEYLEKGMQYLKPALNTSAGDKTSFLLGDAGTYAVAAVMLKEMGDESYADMVQNYTSLYNTFLNPKFLKCGGDELFVGRSGYIAGTLWLRRELNIQVIENMDLFKICDIIVANGREHAKKHKSRCPLMYHYYSTEYLGAAHGISFILQTLMSVPGYLDHNSSAAVDIKASTRFIAGLQIEDGNFPCCMEEIGLNDHKLVHWCHGAPGTIYLMAKAYLVFQDQQFLNACTKAGELVWRKGLLRKGPGICHGVSGNGYVFLLLYRLTGDKKHLFRAKSFADFLQTEEFLRDARLPDNPESLYEGAAGMVCFLSDILTPEKAEFPFMDVFSTYE